MGIKIIIIKESSKENIQKAKNTTAIWFSDTIPGHISKGYKSGYSRHFGHRHFLQHCSE
jgi:hypothetical protein